MSLLSLPAETWNQIARTQRLRTTWARQAFAMTADEMNDLTSREFKVAEKASDTWVAMSLMDMKPLLLENIAISKFTQAQPQYRPALPEVVSIAEAVILASKDCPLNPTQQAQLSALLHDALN